MIIANFKVYLPLIGSSNKPQLKCFILHPKCAVWYSLRLLLGARIERKPTMNPMVPKLEKPQRA